MIITTEGVGEIKGNRNIGDDLLEEKVNCGRKGRGDEDGKESENCRRKRRKKRK